LRRVLRWVGWEYGVVVVRVVVLASVFFVWSAAVARADDGVLRLYSADSFLIDLVEKGLRGSETFRGLYERLEEADVVVNLRRGPERSAPFGYNQFVTAAGGYRFLVITLSAAQPNDDAVALLGHELQHAVELAGETGVTDVHAYEQMYERIGYRSCVTERVRCFETTEAARVSGVVRAELKRKKPADIATAVGDMVRTWLTRVTTLAERRRANRR
jgi:hypothetical protein